MVDFRIILKGLLFSEKQVQQGFRQSIDHDDHLEALEMNVGFITITVSHLTTSIFSCYFKHHKKL